MPLRLGIAGTALLVAGACRPPMQDSAALMNDLNRQMAENAMAAEKRNHSEWGSSWPATGGPEPPEVDEDDPCRVTGFDDGCRWELCDGDGRRVVEFEKPGVRCKPGHRCDGRGHCRRSKN